MYDIIARVCMLVKLKGVYVVACIYWYVSILSVILKL